jgi:hypothetical protein
MTTKIVSLKLSLVSSAKLTDLAPILIAASDSGVVVESSLVTEGALAVDVSPRTEAPTIPAPRAKALSPRRVDAPYGLRKDGSPRSKPGRKSASKRSRGAK